MKIGPVHGVQGDPGTPRLWSEREMRADAIIGTLPLGGRNTPGRAPWGHS